MEQTTIIESLRKIVKPYIQDEAAFAALTEDTRFIEDLKINSANLVDIILDVEDEFDIEIEDEAMEEMLSVKSAMSIINKKISAK